MDVYNQRSISTNHGANQAARREKSLEGALGLVSTRSFPAIVGTADMMLKSAGVYLIGYEKIGDAHCTAIIRGGIADVRLAVEAGERTAKDFGQFVSSLVIPRPYPNLNIVLPITNRLKDFAEGGSQSRLSNLAIGLVETRGFPAMVGAADAMLKAAEVQLAAYEKIGGGLCTAIIRGTVANVAVAVEAGMNEAERIGELSAVMVIPRPLDELENTLPVASCWVEKSQPISQTINIPLSIKEKEKEVVVEAEILELPDLSKLPSKITEYL
ncbi:BMC domain-containing protein [Calothrix sp. PCC 6303]|uniref:BMC domain-containing protein n=1 Tax=Calothrix sp. PCC 6303 TaxID=1170562 RepID=UPI0002A0028F|nr:BMC domain-containing protein [Calothrix sp. PCC 6303]AFY99761.1 microcompartments protein [Calothrix sp. PCC 6303]